MTFWVAGATLGGAVISGIAGNRAAGTQASAADRATQLQQQQWEQQQTNQAPWREAGTNALAQMTRGTQPGGQFTQTFGMNQFNQDPGYAFRMSEGLKALDKTAAARGGLLSGATLKGAQRYGQDLASQEYGAAYGRYNTDRNQQWNQLAGLAGVGQTANTQLNQGGQNYANQAGAGINMAGQAQAAGQYGIGSGINNAIGQGISSYQQNKLLDALRPQVTTPSSSWGDTYAWGRE